jgi:transcriptional regulator with XRE-family HTH domain
MARQRRAHGWTQSQLAKRLAEQVGRDRSYSQTTISQWEHGNAEIPTEVRIALAALFTDLVQPLPTVDRPESAQAGDANARSTPAKGPAVQSDNFQLWRRAAGLDESFPRLPSGSDPFLNRDRERELRKLVDFTASSDGPSVILTFAAGHGITTFARHALRVVHQGDIRSAVLPVPVSLADAKVPKGETLDQARLTERLRRRILAALALKPRESQHLIDWLGPAPTDAPWLLEKLYAPQNQAQGSSFRFESSLTDLPLEGLVSDVRHRGLYISLYVDVSSTPEHAMTAELRRMIEPLFCGLAAIQLEVRNCTNSTFSIVAFATRDEESLLSQALVSADGGMANPEVIEIRPYAPFEVYRMLMDQHGEDLPLKLGSDALLGIVDEGIPLRRTESLLREFLHEQLTNPSRVPYTLGPALSRRGAQGG